MGRGLLAETSTPPLGTYLGVPCELVVYPHTGHGLRAISALEAKMAWDAAWFERYVLQPR